MQEFARELYAVFTDPDKPCTGGVDFHRDDLDLEGYWYEVQIAMRGS
jgi:hypothetical protein